MNADEAFVPGDPQHEGVLKALITEPTITIEAKYRNAREEPNFIHLWISTNKAWAVPASLRSRRWFVLRVSDAHANDHAYFKAIQDQLEANDGGGYAALLHDLLVRKITTDLRKVPMTEALQDQRKYSAEPHINWWIECLQRGYVYRSECGLQQDYFGDWHEFVTTEILYAAYLKYCDRHRVRDRLSRADLGTFLTGLKYLPQRRRNEVVGEEVIGTGGGRKAKLIREKKPKPGYALGDIDAAREAFQQVTRLAIDWEPGEEQP